MKNANLEPLQSPTDSAVLNAISLGNSEFEFSRTIHI